MCAYVQVASYIVHLAVLRTPGAPNHRSGRGGVATLVYILLRRRSNFACLSSALGPLSLSPCTVCQAIEWYPERGCAQSSRELSGSRDHTHATNWIGTVNLPQSCLGRVVSTRCNSNLALSPVVFFFIFVFPF